MIRPQFIADRGCGDQDDPSDRNYSPYPHCAPTEQGSNPLKQLLRAYAASGRSARGPMRAVRTAIPAKVQKVSPSPAAPASLPAMGAPKNCPTAMSRKAAPRPADGRSWMMETDQTRMTPVSIM